MQKKKLVMAAAVVALSVNLGFGATAQAEFRQASQEALETHRGIQVPPGQDSSEDKLPASERFVSSKGISSKLDYQLCLPRWYDSGKTYPLIVVINDVAGETDGKALLKQQDGVCAWADELENKQQYVIMLAIQCTRESEANMGRLSGTEGMNVLRSLLKDIRQNYGVDQTAIYGIGENKGAWAIQLINEEMPSYFKAFYVDENTADGQIDNKAIHDWLMKEMSSRAK